jgi:hypothetical protein
MDDSKLYKKRFQETIDSLNETQKESVLSDAKTLQILAGPGSGKTRGVYQVFLYDTQIKKY